MDWHELEEELLEVTVQRPSSGVGSMLGRNLDEFRRELRYPYEQNTIVEHPTCLPMCSTVHLNILLNTLLSRQQVVDNSQAVHLRRSHSHDSPASSRVEYSESYSNSLACEVLFGYFMIAARQNRDV